ncbi:MAG: hypothetical protein FJ215_05150 [Ignavibacteria bacterium]|nr:hypothetical protein [Ignavibacteria bacterium]
MKTTSWKRALSIALATLAMHPLVLAQVTLQVGGGAGVRMPMDDFAGTTADHYAGTKYGFSTGYNLNAKARIGLLGFKLAGQVDYGTVSNSGEALPGQGSLEISQTIFSMKVGPEFHLGVPLMPVTPYLGANAAFHSFSGEIKIQGVTKLPSGTHRVQSASRIGVGVNGGILVSLGTFTTLDVGIEYALMNISGKTWEDVNLKDDQRLDSYLALNDEKDPLYRAGDDKHFIGNARSINSVLLTVSILFGL